MRIIELIKSVPKWSKIPVSDCCYQMSRTATAHSSTRIAKQSFRVQARVQYLADSSKIYRVSLYIYDPNMAVAGPLTHVWDRKLTPDEMVEAISLRDPQLIWNRFGNPDIIFEDDQITEGEAPRKQVLAVFYNLHKTIIWMVNEDLMRKVASVLRGTDGGGMCVKKGWNECREVLGPSECATNGGDYGRAMRLENNCDYYLDITSDETIEECIRDWDL